MSNALVELCDEVSELRVDFVGQIAEIHAGFVVDPLKNITEAKSDSKSWILS